MKDHGSCDCMHHKMMPMMIGLFILIFGITALLKAMGTVSAGTFAWIWPILIIIASLGKLSTGMCKCC